MPRRFLALTVAACMLVAGGAWAWNALPPRETESVLVAPAPHVPMELAPVPVAPRIESTALPSAPLRLPSLPLAAPPLRARLHTPPPSPSAARSPNSPTVRVPPCTCNAFACDCGPED